MATPVFAAVLLAAMLHAGWNSVVKLGLDRFSALLLLAIVQALIALPVLPFVAAPAAAAWGWIVASAGLHAGYKLLLGRAYREADLSQAYPVARGAAPLMVAAVSVVVLGTRLEPAGLVAVATISVGILLLAFKGSSAAGRMSGLSLAYALATAGFTAGYSLVDGVGARIAGTASGYILWMVLGDALAMAAYAWATRGAAAFGALRPAWRTGAAAGAMSLGSYWIAVWAYTQAPIALVAALRQSSILFAVLIAALLLKEPVGRWRWTAAGIIVLGLVLMKL